MSVINANTFMSYIRAVTSIRCIATSMSLIKIAKPTRFGG